VERMKSTTATRLARQMKSAGLSNYEISQRLAKQGYVSQRTGKPLTTAGVSLKIMHGKTVNRRKRTVTTGTDNVNVATTFTIAKGSTIVGVIRAVVNVSDMTDADKVALIQLLTQ